MADPLSLISLAAAARGGSIDGLEARQLVAAGITMLQRCAPLVRTLTPGRGAVLLPDSAAYLVALAGCEGRGALLLDPEWSRAEIASALDETGARVVFTLERYASVVPESMACVLLDEIPGHAAFVQLAERRRVDLGSHFGFAIEGDGDIEGRDEEAALLRDHRRPGGYASFTHLELLEAGRDVMERAGIVASDCVLALMPFLRLRGLTAALLAPLLAGARVSTISRIDGTAAVERLERDGVTVAVGDAAVFAAMVATLRQRGSALDAPALRSAISVNRPTLSKLSEEWLEVAGTELLEVDTLGSRSETRRC